MSWVGRKLFIETNLRVKINRTQTSFFPWNKRHFKVFFKKKPLSVAINIMLTTFIIFSNCFCVKDISTFSQTVRTQESERPLFEISAERKEKEICYSPCSVPQNSNSPYRLIYNSFMPVLRIWFHIKTISPAWWITLFSSPVC